MLNIVIFGPPGAGKGTQAALLKERFNLRHISTGDVLRSEIKNETELGKKAKTFIDEGHLVPDDLIIRMLARLLDERDAHEGVIFDGFPRTVIQAEALNKELATRNDTVDALVDLRVPDATLVERLLERGKISGRSDDNEEAIKERLVVYHAQTEPVIDYFKELGVYCPIEGVGEIDEIADKIAEAIEKVK